MHYNLDCIVYAISLDKERTFSTDPFQFRGLESVNELEE